MRPRRLARSSRAFFVTALAALAGGCSATVSREPPLSTASIPPRPPAGMVRDAPPLYAETGGLGYARGSYVASRPHPPIDHYSAGRWHAAPARGTMPAGAMTRGGTIIEVQEGDTLYGISQRYGVPVADLIAANQLDSGRVEIGQRLLVPAISR